MDLPYTLAGRYRLERLIGAGSYAETFLATDLKLDRPVAVKVLRSQMTGDGEAAVRFAREASAAASVDNPHVVRVYDSGQDGDTRFIAMEAVFGSTLKQRIQDGAPLPVDAALGYVRQVLDGLAAIHAAGIIHRDIKPQNVLLDQQDQVKLTDFGIARRASDSGLTETGITVGSAAYMAPEQALGEHLTPATDVYAVGIILYELLTGSMPFTSDNPLGVMYQQVHQRAPSARARNPAVSKALDAVVARALAKEPQQRYPSAQAMLAAIDRLMSGQETRLLPAAHLVTVRAARPGAARYLLTAGVVTLVMLASLAVLLVRGNGQAHGLSDAAPPISTPTSSPTPDRGVIGLVPPRPTPTPSPSPTAMIPTPTPTATPTSTQAAPTATPRSMPTLAPTPVPTSIAEPRPTTAPHQVPVSQPRTNPAPTPAPANQGKQQHKPSDSPHGPQPTHGAGHSDDASPHGPDHGNGHGTGGENGHGSQHGSGHGGSKGPGKKGG